MTKLNIKTKLMDITPAWAEKVLNEANTRIEKGDFKNRRISERRVYQYAAAMKSGQWLPTHQGISFDVKGNLLDGQHRLWAVLRSKATVPMLVTTGLPEGNAAIKTMDVLDRGATRSVSQALILSHGYSHNEARAFSAMMRYIGYICTKVTFAFNVAQCLELLSIFEDHARAVLSLCPNIHKAPKLPVAVLVLAHVIKPKEACELAQGVFCLEGLEAGSIPLLLTKYLYSRKMGNKTGRLNAALTTACAVYNYCHGTKMQRLQPSHEAMDWILEQQPENVQRVSDVVMPFASEMEPYRRERHRKKQQEEKEQA